jgi:SAM-dependent methyltransferase
VSRLVQALLAWYARQQAGDVAPHVIGPRVLDLGAAEGYVAAALHRAGSWVCGVDVGRFRRVAVPYVAYDGGRLPFADGVFDTALLLLTLHHCRAPERVLDEAIRVTRQRLIVSESVYRSRLERFWLRRLDGPVNRPRHGGAMAVPLGFRRPEAWRALFESRGLLVTRTRWLGTRWERLIHHPLLFVLDKPARHGSAGQRPISRAPSRCGPSRSGIPGGDVSRRRCRRGPCRSAAAPADH